MLRDSKAFSGFSVDDLDKAKDFYGGTLGLETSMQENGLALVIDGRPSVYLYPKPNHEPATFTVLNFRVTDIDAAVDQLIAAGVTFEQYGEGFDQDERGIARGQYGPPIAWFRDPAGNILSVIQVD